MIIKKKLFILFFITLSASIFNTLSAQYSSIQPQIAQQIAYINSTELLELVPGKAEATKSIEELNKKYKEELLLMQNDYNNKYSDFLSNQNKMAESIKLRRMQELYELEQSINRFMKIAQEDIESQEKNLIAPLKEKLKVAIDQVGIDQNYVCIYDKANTAIAFITPNAIDASQYVKAQILRKK